jgi:hypothetical protein
VGHGLGVVRLSCLTFAFVVGYCLFAGRPSWLVAAAFVAINFFTYFLAILRTYGSIPESK